jgi:2-methylcitrate dehydratase
MTMTTAEEIARFVVKASYEDLSDAARMQLKIRILDSLGCAVGALEGEPVKLVRDQLEDFGGTGLCGLIGGGRTAPDRAAFYNSALVRYLDFNDSYLARHETCHPSDNLGAVLAACEYAGGGGKDLLCALAMAYQVQCRLSDEAPVRARGFDHTTQGSFALAAGLSKALELDLGRTVNALALCGTAFNALRVTRTGALSHWKGLAYPNTAFCCTHAVFLAMRGITGPGEVFEGNKGFIEAISGPFAVNWSEENLESVTRTIIKKFNAEIHSQSTLEGILELRTEYDFSGKDVVRIDIDTFDVAYNIIGGGEEGDKTLVRTKEEADHSLPYMVAVAVLDGQVMPEQYKPERIHREDVQALLKKVFVRPEVAFSERFPQEMPCRLRVILRDGRMLKLEKQDYEGFHTNPLPWERVVSKFHSLTKRFIDPDLQLEIIETVRNLELVQVEYLVWLLERISSGTEAQRGLDLPQ